MDKTYGHLSGHCKIAMAYNKTKKQKKTKKP